MEKINYEDVLIVSCILGDKYTIIYDAPASSPNCYFFTNNQNQKDVIISKGWNYEYVDIEMTDEEIPCSLQSKYIKFLQFLDDYDGKFKKFKQILSVCPHNKTPFQRFYLIAVILTLMFGCLCPFFLR